MVAVLPEVMKKIDANTVEKCNISFKKLMSNAAKAVFDTVIKAIDPKEKCVILCGKGNNGGDGYALAALLKEYGCPTVCINVFNCRPLSEEGKFFADKFVDNGGVITSCLNEIDDLLSGDVIFDCILGTGFDRSIDTDSDIYSVIDHANRNKSALKIAVDIPSGVNGKDGTVNGICFNADITVTLAAPKPGLFSYPGRQHCGEIIVADIGIPKEIINSFGHNIFITDDKFVSDTLPVRPNNSHKGTFGNLLALCGSINMTGAPTLAAMGALRSGVGLFTQVADSQTLKILQTKLTEPVFMSIDYHDSKDIGKLIEKSKKHSAFLVGCGLGDNQTLPSLMKKIICECDCRIIIDGDGINALSSNINILKEANIPPVITPHPLEFSRVSGHTVKEINDNRLNVAKDFAKHYNCIVVLKGAGTVIASPDGRAFINPTGNSALAKGGTGDVLAGVIASFCAQGIDGFSAAVCGVYLHGKAGDILSEKYSHYGVIAGDLPLEIAKLL